MEEMLETLHGERRVEGEAMAALQSQVREAEDLDWSLESREQWKELEGKLKAGGGRGAPGMAGST